MAMIPFFKRQATDNKFSEVLGKLKALQAQQPNDLRIQVKIAELYLENGKKKEAINEYLAAARSYQAKRLFQISVAIYNHVISISPDLVEVYTDLANLHLRNGFIGDGVAVLEKLASRFYENGMDYEATQVLHKIHQIDPNNEFFKIKIGKMYQGGELAGAQATPAPAQDSVGIIEDAPAPTEPAAEYEPAQGGFDLASALSGDRDLTFTPPSDSSENAGMSPDDVFNQLKNMVANADNLDSPQFHFNFGLAYMRCKEYDEAISEFQAALGGLDNKLECYINLSECHLAVGRFDDANNMLAKALKLPGLTQKDKLGLVYQSGLIYKDKGDTQKALKVFKKVHEVDRSFRSVDIEIKNLLLKT